MLRNLGYNMKKSGFFLTTILLLMSAMIGVAQNVKLVMEGNYKGLTDGNGKELIPPVFGEIKISGTNYEVVAVRVNSDDYYQLYNYKYGKTITPDKYFNVIFNNQYIVVYNDNELCKILDYSGKELTNWIKYYNYLNSKNERTSLIKVVDQNGKFILYDSGFNLFKKLSPDINLLTIGYGLDHNYLEFSLLSGNKGIMNFMGDILISDVRYYTETILPFSPSKYKLLEKLSKDKEIQKLYSRSELEKLMIFYYVETEGKTRYIRIYDMAGKVIVPTQVAPKGYQYKKLTKLIKYFKSYFLRKEENAKRIADLINTPYEKVLAMNKMASEKLEANNNGIPHLYQDILKPQKLLVAKLKKEEEKKRKLANRKQKTNSNTKTTVVASNTKKSNTSTQTVKQNYNRQDNRKAVAQNNNDPFPGYTRVAGGIPQVGEKRYWHKSGTMAYCSIECYNANGTVLYTLNPEPIDYQHPGARYMYQSNSNGWYVFKRVNIQVYTNFRTYSVETAYNPIPGELLISTDGKTVVCRDGTRYDTPITKETANLLVQKQNEFIAKGIGSGAITLDNQPSEIEKQIKDEIDEIDRKQSQRNQKELKDAITRDEINRGHRTIRYNSTNTQSTKTVWCSVCKRYDKPHTHPLNDGRH